MKLTIKELRNVLDKCIDAGCADDAEIKIGLIDEKNNIYHSINISAMNVDVDISKVEFLSFHYEKIIDDYTSDLRNKNGN